MAGMEPKKMALLRIYQILWQYSDCNHPLKQEDIVKYLKQDFDIEIERKAVGRDIGLLKEAGADIVSEHTGSYLAERLFDDAELRLLIDSVLASKHIAVKQSSSLIDRISLLSNIYFRKHIRHIFTVNEWDKTENKELFYNISLMDEAIESGKQVEYSYNKYGIDKTLHKTSTQKISPYQMIVHNQKYYLMGYNERWGHVVYHRIDRITDTKICETDALPLRRISGYENGVPYKDLSTAMPYMYTDKPVRITFKADICAIDQIIDWFGKDIVLTQENDTVTATVRSSPTAMLYWAMQYADCVEIISPSDLRERIKNELFKASEKYNEEKRK